MQLTGCRSDFSGMCALQSSEIWPLYLLFLFSESKELDPFQLREVLFVFLFLLSSSSQFLFSVLKKEKVM